MHPNNKLSSSGSRPSGNAIRLGSLAAFVVLAAIAASTPMAGPAGEAAIALDPFDPTAKIGMGMGADACADDACRRERARARNSVVLDCSGRRHGAAHTLRDAVRRAPVNGEILILGAPAGRTCAGDGTVIDKPLTIRPFDGIGTATIEGTHPPPVSPYPPIGGYSSVDGNASALISLHKWAEQLKRDSAKFGAQRPFLRKNDKHPAVETAVEAAKTDLENAEEDLQDAKDALALAATPAEKATKQKDVEDKAKIVEVKREAHARAEKALHATPALRLCKIQADIEALGAEGARLAGTAQRARDKDALAGLRAEAEALDKTTKDIADRLSGDADTEEPECEFKEAPANAAKASALAAIASFRRDLAQIVALATQIAGLKPGEAAPAQVAKNDNASCLEAKLPTGDTLNLIGVNFVVRGGNYPCVNVLAGTVRVQHARIDSRGTNWAFDVGASGRLVMEDTKIETDAGGIRARRATVDLRGVHVQLERGRRGVGASLVGAEGMVSRLKVVGGEIGLIVSAGSGKIVIDRPEISYAGVGLNAVGHPGQGTVEIVAPNIENTVVGVWIRNNARAQIIGGSIRASERVGILISDSGALVRGVTHVGGGDYAVAVRSSDPSKPAADAPTDAPAADWSGLCTARAPGDKDGFGDVAAGCDYKGDLPDELGKLGISNAPDTSAVSPLGTVEIDQNTIGPAEKAAVQLKASTSQRVVLTNNILDCPRGQCIGGDRGRARHIEKRGNRCTGDHRSCND